MSAPVNPGHGEPGPPMVERAFGPDRPPGPVVRLPTWVNVVLVLILLASCGGAGAASSSDSDAATRNDVRDMCRLLDVVAEKQGIDANEVLGAASSGTACQEGLAP